MKSKDMNKIIKVLLLCLLVSSCVQKEMNEVYKYQAEMEEQAAGLEKMCGEMNESITALKILIDAGESGDYVTGFKELTDGSGYTITFAKAGTITIRHGAKGDDGIKGEDGADGTPGNDGENGSDGTPGNDGAPGEPGNPGQPGQPGDKGENGVVPLVSVKQDTDGEWYWAVSVGSQEKTFILDDNGQKVTAKGKDGITPVVGVNAAGNWTIDMGTGPVEITDDSGNLFRAKGEDGDPLFESVKKSNGYILFNLADGTTFEVPEWTGAAGAKLEVEGVFFFRRGETKEIAFTCNGTDNNQSPVCTPLNGWAISALYNQSKTGGTITITAPLAGASDPVLSGTSTLSLPTAGNQPITLPLEVTMLYELKAPSTTASFVFEVLFEGVKVGELCHEFIPGYSFDAGKPAIVFYPHNIYNQSTGKGLVLDNGGSIDYETLQYTAGSDPAATSLFTENGTDFFTGNYLGYTGDNSLGCVPCRITDYEGNAYKIMKIGSQYWMAENLRTLTDGQGQAIASDLTEDQWKNGRAGCAIYGFPDGADAANKYVREQYGVLYNGRHFLASSESPVSGWKVPDHLADWDKLRNYLGNTKVARALKIAGFIGSPGGRRDDQAVFKEKDKLAYWWFNSIDGSNCWALYIDPEQVDYPDDTPDSGSLNNALFSRVNGFSIRCIRE